MKIFYVVDARIPTEKAHGYQIMKTCEALAASGFEIELVVPTVENTIKTDPFIFYGIARSFSIRHLPMPNIPRSWPFPFAIIPYYISLFLFVRAARRHVRERALLHPVVYTRTGVLVLFLARFAPVIYEAHGFSRFALFFRCRYSKSAHIVAVTEGIRSILMRHGAEPSRVTVIPDGVDLSAFQSLGTRLECRMARGLPPLEKIIGYIGRFTVFNKEKGVATLVMAMGILKKRGIVARLLLVGGPDSSVSEYRRIADACGFGGDSIFYVPQVPARDVGGFMRACDALVIPLPRNAFSAFYTSPLKMFEYMASGTPIVASDLPALREVLTENNAFFAMPDSPHGLAAAISSVLGAEDVSAKRAVRAMEDVRQYGWGERARRISECIAGSLGAGYDTP